MLRLVRWTFVCVFKHRLPLRESILVATANDPDEALKSALIFRRLFKR
jgi:hypothetical protein